MDSKTSKMFVNGMVLHLQKDLRSYDGKDPEVLIRILNEYTTLFQRAMSVTKKTKKKKAVVPKTKKKEDATDAVPVASGTESS